jgi:hypothetical protein
MSNEAMLEELREIRKLLTPAPPPDPPEGLINEFVDFISQYKVLGLAVAFILGIYWTGCAGACEQYHHATH